MELQEEMKKSCACVGRVVELESPYELLRQDQNKQLKINV
jgi:hypothetical protein